MAEDTTDTRPGSDPGVLKTGADGSLPDLGGRQAWVWMQDTDEGGGGRFDVRADRIDVWKRRGATVVPNYPINFDRSARNAKPRQVLLAGDRPEGGEAFIPRTAAAPTVQSGAEPTRYAKGGQLDQVDAGAAPPAAVAEPAAADTTDQAAGDAGEADTAPAPAEAEHTNQDAGDAGGDTTIRKGGRRR